MHADLPGCEIDIHGQARFKGPYRLVLGPVILEDTVYLGNPAYAPDVADEDQHLEEAVPELEGDAADVAAKMKLLHAPAQRVGKKKKEAESEGEGDQKGQGQMPALERLVIGLSLQLC